VSVGFSSLRDGCGSSTFGERAEWICYCWNDLGAKTARRLGRARRWPDLDGNNSSGIFGADRRRRVPGLVRLRHGSC
jgi:hypothetical protein